MANWSEHDPGAGELGDLGRRIRRLAEHADHASEMKRTMLQVADGLGDDWSGDAYDSWSALTDHNAAEWWSLHEWAETEQGVLRRYVAAVESIKERAARQKALLAIAHDNLDGLTEPDDIEDEELSVDSATSALEALAQERREADAALIRGLDEVRAPTARLVVRHVPKPAELDRLSPAALLGFLSALPPEGLEELVATYPKLGERLASADPADVAAWWKTVDHHQALIDLAPSIIGSLDGLPPAARVAANRLVAIQRLEIDAVTLIGLGFANAAVPGGSRSTLRKIDLLKREMSYLRRVEAGTVQLYLYDPDASRIIEMLGTPSPATKHVITYVPGTFTNLGSFYTNGVQQMAKALQTDHRSDAVAFVYKDGKFPGEDDDGNEQSMLRLAEANQPGKGLVAGHQLAEFESGIRAAGLDHVSSSAIGHSWGLANVTSSEVFGAHYDHVFSLSGAWAPRQWRPSPTTTYADLSYDDILQKGAWFIDQTPPRQERAFDALPYFKGPEGMDPLALHNLVATNSTANRKVFLALEARIFGE